MRENNPITCDIHSFCVTQQVVHQLKADIVDGNGCVNSIDHRQGCRYVVGLRLKRGHTHIHNQKANINTLYQNCQVLKTCTLDISSELIKQKM